MKILSIIKGMLLLGALILGAYVFDLAIDNTGNQLTNSQKLRKSVAWFGNRTESDMAHLAINLRYVIQNRSVEDVHELQRDVGVVWSLLRLWREDPYLKEVGEELNAEPLLIDIEAFLIKYDDVFQDPLAADDKVLAGVGEELRTLLDRLTEYSFDVQAYEVEFFGNARKRIEETPIFIYQLGGFTLLLITLVALLGNYQYRKVEEANSRVKNLVDATNESAQPIFVATGKGSEYSIEFVNESMAEIIGVSAEHCAGQSLRTLLEGHAGMDTSWLTKPRASSDWRTDIDVHMHNNENSREPHWYKLSVASKEGDKKGTSILYGALLDINELKLSEQKLKRAASITAQATKEKSRFVSVVSHELRTPLNSLNMALHLAKDENDSDRRGYYLEQAVESMRTLQMHTDSVTRYAEIDNPHFKLRFTPFNVRDLVATIIKDYRLQAKEKSLEVELVDRKLTYPRLYGDAPHIKQIVQQFYDNAVKFSSHGKITFSLETTVVNDKQVALKIVCTDSGRGIDSKVKSSVFNAFNKETPGVGRGIGIGLSSARRLAQKMGGDFSIQSELGKGTSIALELILEKCDEVHKPVPTTDLNWKKLNCLVIDDSAPNRRLLSAILRSKGASVEIAEGGAEGLELLKEHDFNLILVDLYMPNMEGDEFIRIVRALDEPTCNIPAIVVTATAESSSLNRAIAAGANDILSKPFTNDELVAVMMKQFIA